MIAAALASGATTVAFIFFWSIARRTATIRGLSIGTFPPALLASAAAAAWIAGTEGTAHWTTCMILAGVAVAALVDARTGVIFNPLSAIIVLLAATAATIDRSLPGAIVGAAVVAAALGALYASTHGTGIGLGDVKLGLGVGAALGSSTGLGAVALAFIFGAGYGLWLIATCRATRRSAIRFGPFLAAGTFAAVLAPGLLP